MSPSVRKTGILRPVWACAQPQSYVQQEDHPERTRVAPIDLGWRQPPGVGSTSCAQRSCAVQGILPGQTAPFCRSGLSSKTRFARTRRTVRVASLGAPPGASGCFVKDTPDRCSYASTQSSSAGIVRRLVPALRCRRLVRVAGCFQRRAAGAPPRISLTRERPVAGALVRPRIGRRVDRPFRSTRGAPGLATGPRLAAMTSRNRGREHGQDLSSRLNPKQEA